jgi:hypothetical protein
MITQAQTLIAVLQSAALSWHQTDRDGADPQDVGLFTIELKDGSSVNFNFGDQNESDLSFWINAPDDKAICEQNDREWPTSVLDLTAVSIPPFSYKKPEQNTA